MATQDQVNEATSSLNAAITDAVMMYAGENSGDLTALIDNPGFELSEAFSGNVATGGNPNSIDYASTGWTNTSAAGWCASGVVEYGSESLINGEAVPNADNDDNAGKGMAMSIGWSGTITYKSVPVTLPAGIYELRSHIYNALPVTAFPSKFGFVSDDASYLSTLTSVPQGVWTEDFVKFELTEATTGYVQIGATALNAGSGSHGKVMIDNITLTYVEEKTSVLNEYNAAYNAAVLSYGNNNAYVGSPEGLALKESIEATVDESNTVEETRTATENLTALTALFDEAVQAYQELDRAVQLAQQEIADGKWPYADPALKQAVENEFAYAIFNGSRSHASASAVCPMSRSC